MVLGCGPYHIGKSFLQLLCCPCTLELPLDILVVHLFLFSYGGKTLQTTVRGTSIPNARFAFWRLGDFISRPGKNRRIGEFYYSSLVSCDFHKVL